MNYAKGKEIARQKAKDWQIEERDFSYSQEGFSFVGNFFNKIGKRYGLLREFRENCIPC